MSSCSRRDLLSTAITLGVAGSAGCLGNSDEPVYSLNSYALGSNLGNALLWSPQTLAYSQQFQQSIADRLRREGSVRSPFQLAPRGMIDGETVTPPRFFDTAEGYERILISQVESVAREVWVLRFEEVDGTPPNGATVVSSSPGDLSPPDERAFEVAAGLTRVVREEGRYGTFDFPPSVESDDRDLLPDPPFDYVELTIDGERTYFEASADRETVELKMSTHELELVGETRAEYDSYLDETVVKTVFDRESASDEVGDILAELGREDPYQERPELSEPYVSVLERLELSGIEPPDPTEWIERTHGDVYFGYDDRWFFAELSIYYERTRTLAED
jgi:hypothetical protein